MPDDRSKTIPPAPPAPTTPPTTRRGSWLRYHWPKIFIHLLLIILGVLNIYAFFWMLGTSVKAEAEASNNRLSPFPHGKYKLADDFELEDVLPTAMQPGLATAAGDRRSELLNVLEKKLQVLQHLQKNAWTFNVRHRAEQLYVSEDPAYQRKQQEVEELREYVKSLQAVEDDAGPVEVRRQQIEQAEADLAKAEEDLEKLKTELEAPAYQALVNAGVLAEDPANRSTWLSEAAFGGETKGMGPKHARIAAELRDDYSIEPKDYARITRQEIGPSRRQMEQMLRAGLLRRVPAAETADDDEEPPLRVALAPGARGRIYRDMYPRQILTLWSMHEENIRRHESRATFATDRWSPDDYRKNFGLNDEEWAENELEELADAGLLTGGTFQVMNYWVVLKEENFLLHFLTSLVITAAVVILTVLLSSMLGYALARIRFPGKMVVLGVMISAAVLPGEARIIPIFKMLMAIRAMQNLWGMVLWLASFGVGNALLMAAFFLTLPRDVDEAAEVDGAGVWRKFFDVALPMARPIVVTVALFAFLTAWNNFLVPLVCTISRPSMQPLAVAVYNFQQGHPGKWHQINAAAALMIVPVILMFLLVQKHVVRSIAVGAVKG
jgi:raffinose/stachyose/melibiose transport system permease protein